MSVRLLMSVVVGLSVIGSTGIVRAAPPDAVVSVNGHALWGRDTGGVYANHQPYIESTMVNAWLGADGRGHGTIVWMDVYNGPFDAQGNDHGEAVSGYAWQVEVDTVIVLGPGEVFVEGEITHSNVEEDVGSRNGFYIYDGGVTGIDALCPTINFGYDPEFLPSYAPVLGGNFSIR